jgi:hypothetical protein
VPGAGDPQRLNRYAYARNNPASYTDPSGHVPRGPAGGAAGLGAAIRDLFEAVVPRLIVDLAPAPAAPPAIADPVLGGIGLGVVADPAVDPVGAGAVADPVQGSTGLDVLVSRANENVALTAGETSHPCVGDCVRPRRTAERWAS